VPGWFCSNLKPGLLSFCHMVNMLNSQLISSVMSPTVGWAQFTMPPWLTYHTVTVITSYDTNKSIIIIIIIMVNLPHSQLIMQSSHHTLHITLWTVNSMWSVFCCWIQLNNMMKDGIAIDGSTLKQHMVSSTYICWLTSWDYLMPSTFQMHDLSMVLNVWNHPSTKVWVRGQCL
jgi:hypothetical protein